MDLITFLHYVIIAAALFVVFRNFDERGAQFFAIVCLSISAIALMAGAGFIPLSATWKLDVVFPVAIAVLSLIILVKIVEKSFPLLMLFAAATQILVVTQTIRSLR